MSDEHKAAIASGRVESKAVKDYLEAIDQNRPKRGRKRTPDSINNRLGRIDSELAQADAMKRLSLIQERLDLLEELARMEDTVDLSGLEADFVEVAASYGERKGISYAAWREVGVQPSVLKAAGIGRGQR